MIRSRIFRKYAFVALLLTVCFVALGALAHFAYIVLQKHEARQTPEGYFAKLVEGAPYNDRTRVVEFLTAPAGTDFRPSLWLLDESRHVLAGPSSLSPPEWLATVPLPTRAEEPGVLDTSGTPGPPRMIFKLAGMAPQFLAIDRLGPPDGPGGQHGPHGMPGPPGFLGLLLSIIIGAILASLTTLGLLIYALREKARLADTVISELQHGNLKARFPITSLDEIGQSMVRFNTMAEEIERLVENLRQVETSRRRLLQELAHDLRTPIASLQNLLETMVLRDASLKTEVRAEILSLSMKEVEYFARLVEDLLFLAQVSDPHYSATFEDVPFGDVIKDELGAVAARHPGRTGRLTQEDGLPAHWAIVGDEHLVRRLLRNTLDNAFSFARSEVHVRISSRDGALEVTVADDGPGFSPEALAAFGERRITRSVGVTADGSRLSVGLGSVIMRSVAALLRGSVAARNETSSDGLVKGAVVSIVFEKIKTI